MSKKNINIIDKKIFHAIFLFVWLCAFFLFSVHVNASELLPVTPFSYQDGYGAGGWIYDISAGEESAEEKLLYESISENSISISENDIIKIESSEEVSSEAALQNPKSKRKYPKSYDPRKTGKVTSQKCQGTWGLCWAFSAAATMESALITSGLADENVNLSEMQFVYFAYLDYQEELKENGSAPISFTDFCKMGGLSQAYDLLRDGTGPMNENVLTKEQELTDTFMLPSEYRSKADYNLQCIFDIKMSDISAVKEAVYEYGGVNAYYYSSEYFYLDLVNKEWDSSYYRPGKIKPPNHAVEVIGWDDNFSKKNFAAEPEHNGAWLVKNSWGEEGYYQEYGSGFYWISYEEPTISVLSGVAVTFSDKECSFVSEADNYGISIIDTRNKCLENISIPAEMTIAGKSLPITGITDTAFQGNKHIKSIKIGDNVEEIEPEAFKGCTNLKTVTFGKKLRDIGFDAFSGCKSLQTINLPASVEMVEERAFYGCKSLKSITLGKKCVYIGDKAFYGCKRLKKITSKASSLWYIGKKAFGKTPKKKRLIIRKRKKDFLKQYKKALKK